MQTTRPVPADRDAPVRRPVALADLAIDTGIPAEHVGAYQADRAAYLSAPYRFVAVVVELAQVRP